MRRVLFAHARRRRAAKHPDPGQRIDIVEIVLPSAFSARVDQVELDSALDRLAELSPRQGQVVGLKFLAELEREQMAGMLELARQTVVRDWRMVRAWLQRELA